MFGVLSHCFCEIFRIAISLQGGTSKDGNSAGWKTEKTRGTRYTMRMLPTATEYTFQVSIILSPVHLSVTAIPVCLLSTLVRLLFMQGTGPE
jgi:hypothetical protein